jgi:hypothetical protein
MRDELGNVVLDVFRDIDKGSAIADLVRFEVNTHGVDAGMKLELATRSQTEN